MSNREQIRPESEIVGKRKDDSSLLMSRETEQRLIREFHSPFPTSDERRDDSALLRNASWHF